ncbi:Glyoxylase, beta-lactamase superfamily II [Lentzea albidocapillata subsp. violacea]|uniref:Glyoxylase, beta-lactamase superfamily II n=1 Tax=Lentzea albidocapillata subsp. violacea TaxID=128104 RepID=A0A1G9XML4_9PSEU|nr:MBL fold metallo-hydrolase [Lentzea albidocapillata]SDM97445.1 Glyoxylase, beta-lactamase superfamily II [Lentzea albidocapillata subsp. violacea]
MNLPDPAVHVSGVTEVADGVLVIPNEHVGLVPNIGIVGGTEAILVVDTGLGLTNAALVRDFAEEVARGRRIHLTTTHFHPEHAFGSSVFDSYLINRAQADDLRRKGSGYLRMFRGFGGAIAERLADVEIPVPDEVFDGVRALDLGGRTVLLRPTGRGHTLGDQVVEVPDAGVLFTGDLAETGQFAIFPWFPPHDTDVSGLAWIGVLDGLIAGEPRVVVPGHGSVGDVAVLQGVRDYLGELRDETWRRRDSAAGLDEIVAEVTAVLAERHPEWAGREWIEPGVGCLCAE